MKDTNKVSIFPICNQIEVNNFIYTKFYENYESSRIQFLS